MLNPLRKRLLRPVEQMLQHLIVGEPVKDLRLLPDQLFLLMTKLSRRRTTTGKQVTLLVSSSFEVMFKFFKKEG